PPRTAPSSGATSAPYPRARQFEAFQPNLRDATDLLYRALDAAIGQAGEADLAVRVVALRAPPITPLRRFRPFDDCD
ncbi:MAG TPA: hypothetical protein VE687_12885, partial [Stellaceae bacterium]|nr:hypothetical protein [Stellaceae bacterium]